MPLNDLTDMTNAITAGTQDEKIAFAELIVQAQQFLDNQNATIAAAADAASMVIANDWWDTTIQPTLLWDNTQSLTDQRANILIDYNNVKLLLDTETDPFRIRVINTKLEQANTKFKQIKEAIV